MVWLHVSNNNGSHSNCNSGRDKTNLDRRSPGIAKQEFYDEATHSDRLLRQVVSHGVEGAGKVATNGLHGSDDGDRDSGGDQAVFDGGGTAFVLGEFLDVGTKLLDTSEHDSLH